MHRALQSIHCGKKKAGRIAEQHERHVNLRQPMIITQCLNTLTSEIIIMGYKCYAKIADLPNHYASKKFIPLFAWAHMYTMLGALG